MPLPSKPCKFCGSLSHWPFQCYKRPKSKALQKPRKAIKPMGKYARKWIETRAEWIRQNPGPWVCHYGGCALELGTMELDHKEPRSRRPDLRYVLENLVPSCHFHNSEKQSLSHDEYRHVCHT